MSFANKELRRRPGRFVAAGIILSLISIVLVLVGGILDGLYLGATGALRAQPADVLVLASGSGDTLGHSRIDRDLRSSIASAPSVEEVSTISAVSLSARSDEDASRDVFGVSLVGIDRVPFADVQLSTDGVLADERLRERGLVEGASVYLAAGRVPVTVEGFVPAAGHLGEPTLWATVEVWRDVVEAARPDQRIGDGVSHGVLATGRGTPADLAADIDRATSGATETRPLDEAIEALPGVAEQREVFNQIIGVTVMVAVIVIAMFFALITLERTALYGVLKAIGMGTGRIFGGVLAQAFAVALGAALIGIGVGALLSVVVPAGDFPFVLTPGRIGSSLLFLTLAAAIGSSLTLRRILRVDPASSIGAST